MARALLLRTSNEEEASLGDALDAGCQLNPTCRGVKSASEFVSDPVGTISGGAFEDLGDMVNAGIAEMITFLGTMWTRVPSPSVTGEVEKANPAEAAGTYGVAQILDYVMYVGFIIAIISLMAAGALMAVRLRQGEGLSISGRIMMVLLGTTVIGASGGIAAALGKGMLLRGSSTIVFVQNQLFWVAIAIVVLSIIIGGIRMAYQQDGRSGVELAKSIGLFIVVSGAGTTAVGLLIGAGDEFTEAILDASLVCDNREGTACFGEGLSMVLGMDPTGVRGWENLGLFWTILLGLLLGFAGLIQAALMYFRTIVIGTLLGLVIVAAAGTNMRVGKHMWDKYLGWMLAFILYKPAAGVIYATAFYPIAEQGDSSEPLEMVDQFWGAIGGLVLLGVALFALPALMKLLVPAAGALAGGAGAGIAGALAAGVTTVATGAKAVAGSGGGGGGNATNSMNNTPSGASGGSLESRSNSKPQPVNAASSGGDGNNGPTGGNNPTGGGGGGDGNNGPTGGNNPTGGGGGGDGNNGPTGGNNPPGRGDGSNWDDYVGNADDGDEDRKEGPSGSKR